MIEEEGHGDLVAADIRLRKRASEQASKQAAEAVQLRIMSR